MEAKRVAVPASCLSVCSRTGHRLGRKALLRRRIAPSASRSRRCQYAETDLRTRRGLILGNVAVSALIGLPLLPQSLVAATPLPSVYPDIVESIGWPAFVRQVEAVKGSLSHEDQTNSLILARNYGQAGAINLFGNGRSRVSSSHNQFWVWGPPDERPDDPAEVVIAVGYDRVTLQTIFRDVTPAGHITMPDDIDNQEQGALLFVCRGRRASWNSLWPSLKNYS